jgi:hypothetical protein
MKKIMLIVCCSIISLNVFSQDAAAKTKASGNPSLEYTYCAKVIDGKMMMTQEGKQMTSDVTLENGTKITTDANVITANGAKTALRSGQCVDKDGRITEPQKDMKKSDDSKMEHR